MYILHAVFTAIDTDQLVKEIDTLLSVIKVGGFTLFFFVKLDFEIAVVQKN